MDGDGFLGQIFVSQDLGFSSSFDIANGPCQVKRSQVVVWVSERSSEVLILMSVRTPISFQGLNVKVTEGTDIFGVDLFYTSLFYTFLLGHVVIG